MTGGNMLGNHDDNDDDEKIMLTFPKVSNVNQSGKAEGEAVIVYPDHLTLLAASFEDGKMVHTSYISHDVINLVILLVLCPCFVF